jgi:acyl-CoA synthetase (AMP-forming)/AMP-acid ligase II
MDRKSSARSVHADRSRAKPGEDVRIAHCANAFFEQRVALWARSSCQWAVASLAVLFAGGTLVPVRTVPTLSALAPGSPA